MDSMKSAVLIHLLDWRSEAAQFDLEGEVSLCRTAGSEVERLYHHLCEADNLDDGDAYSFHSHILISDSAHDELFPYWGGPFSVVSRCCNTIALCTSCPLGMCRLISSRDDFHTSWISSVIYEQNPNVEILRAYPDCMAVSSDGTVTVKGEQFPALDGGTMREIATCWNTQLRLLSTRGTHNHRIENALSYFFYSWRSYYLDHVCLNLAIVLESLFSPSSSQELSHQIAFNVSRFCEKGAKEREAIYRTIKRFYAVRSQIVHGGKAKDRDLFTLTPEVFHLCARILKSILSNYAIAQRFCREEERSTLFREWMFGE
jgi:hypothetical protein